MVPPLPQWVLDAFSTPNATLMTKGNAKSTFCLNEKDLANLPVIYKANPHYRSAAPMCLYKLLDLKAACLNKYGSPAGLLAKSAKNLSAAEKRRDTLATKPPPPPRQKRYREEDGYYSDGGGSGSGSGGEWENDIVCGGCGSTGAVDCITESCCHCCKDSGAGDCCPRHGRY